MKRILLSPAAKPTLFLMLCLPAISLAVQAWGQQLGPNPVEAITRATGVWTLRILLLSLTITPARRLLNMPHLIRFRRMTGLFAFFYGELHFITYIWLDKFFDTSEVLADLLKRPFITAGFGAFFILIPLAITSTQGWIRRLGGRGWQLLHRSVYGAAILGVVHYWWLVKSDLRLPAFYGALMAILFLYRVLYTLRPRQLTVQSSQS